MRAETLRLLTILDLYGPTRRLGLEPPEALAALFEDASMLGTQAAALEASIKQGPEKARAVADGVAGGMGTAGAIIAAIPSPGITQLVGGIVAVAGALVSAFTRLLTWECDKYECPKPVSYHRRGLVGLNMPPGAIKYDDGGCFYAGNRKCALIKYVHDGYVADAPKSDDPDLSQGRVQGVTARTWGQSGSRYLYWRRHSSTPSLPDAEWKKRSDRVTDVLVYLQEHVPCRYLKCLQEVMLSTDNFEERRRRGSRWFSSIVQLMYDFQKLVRAIGYSQAIAQLTKYGRTNEARALKEYVEGKRKDGANPPVPLWSVWKDQDWFNLEGAFRELVAQNTDYYATLIVERNRRIKALAATADRQEFQLPGTQAVRVMVTPAATAAAAPTARLMPQTQVAASAVPQGLMQLDFSRMQATGPAEKQFYGTVTAPQRESFLQTTTGKLVLAGSAATAALAFIYFLRKR